MSSERRFLEVFGADDDTVAALAGDRVGRGVQLRRLAAVGG